MSMESQLLKDREILQGLYNELVKRVAELRQELAGYAKDREILQGLYEGLSEREWSRDGEPYRASNYCASCDAQGHGDSDIPPHASNCKLAALLDAAKKILKGDHE